MVIHFIPGKESGTNQILWFIAMKNTANAALA